MSINLDNFEGDFARVTPYVLTCPTSLEACAKLRVQPKDLIYRSIEEYEEIYSDLPLNQVYEIYEEHETRRQGLLLKCRKMRDEIQRKDRNASNLGVTFKEECNNVRYSSDTESQDEDKKPNVYPSRSMPDLRTNLDFRKVRLSPREYCPCQFQFDDEQICHSYLQGYCDLPTRANLSEEDRKILECLALKKGRALEWDKKSQEVRKKLEREQLRRCREEELLTQRWQDRLTEKRKVENIENARRYMEIQEKWNHSRENLQRQLYDRDKRLQKYLEDLNHHKRIHILEKQKAEALRQFEVGKAIEKLMEEDRTHRQRLREQLQKRMKDAELRKRRREVDYWRVCFLINCWMKINMCF
ncbi:unnamed protein product [Allacma fusca]|uniref:Uncharacterized protein n=1 Tax=Allacma fusca TaxID=39272 RepID=A0A8J2PZ95_9HEXA|nr:unnamed protein product [Allacma fusca]